MKAELPPCKSGEDYLGVNCADPECGEIIRIDRTWPAQIFENGHAALGMGTCNRYLPALRIRWGL